MNGRWKTATALALSLWALSTPCFSSSQRANVLLIFSDDQRPDTIAALGNGQVRTPNLDRLAETGATFTQAYVMGGLQGAVCVPSRAMLMTSRSLFRVKENLEGEETWPEQFARAGYKTFITGKWHNGTPALRRVFQEGRNVFLGGMSEAHQMPVRDLRGGQLGPERISPVHHTELFAESAVEFLKGHASGEPFLCYVAFKVPHDPRTATDWWHGYYNRALPPEPANALPVHPFDNGEMTIRDEQLLPWPRSTQNIRQAWADYYACISHMDEQIGRILDTIRERGWDTNTLVVFAGDNGLALGSHGLLGKQNLYEHSVGVPLIFSGPGVPKNERNAALCYLLDVFPTIAELTGVSALPKMDGTSLVPLLRHEKGQVRDRVFMAYRDVQRAIRDERWKLIRYPKIDKTQLFDLREDPEELDDLADSMAYAGQVRRLIELLQGEQSRFGDRLALTVAEPKTAAWTPPQKQERQ